MAGLQPNSLNKGALNADGQHPLNTDIAVHKNNHEDMTFFIPPDITLNFKLNPQEYRRVSEPVETELATATSWYTFRWQVKPALYTIEAYCGFQGKTIDTIMDSLEGRINVVWTWPYLGPAKNVKIMTVTRIRSASTPYGAKYQIVMREINPTVRITRSNITQFRINDSFLSPQVYTPTNIGKNSTAMITVRPDWSSLLDAANYISQTIPSTRLNTAAQHDAMILLNNNLKRIDGWSIKDKDGNRIGPRDISGDKELTELSYEIAN